MNTLLVARSGWFGVFLMPLFRVVDTTQAACVVFTVTSRLLAEFRPTFIGMLIIGFVALVFQRTMSYLRFSIGVNFAARLNDFNHAIMFAGKIKRGRHIFVEKIEQQAEIMAPDSWFIGGMFLPTTCSIANVEVDGHAVYSEFVSDGTSEHLRATGNSCRNIRHYCALACTHVAITIKNATDEMAIKLWRHVGVFNRQTLAWVNAIFGELFYQVLTRYLENNTSFVFVQGAGKRNCIAQFFGKFSVGGLQTYSEPSQASGTISNRSISSNYAEKPSHFWRPRIEKGFVVGILAFIHVLSITPISKSVKCAGGCYA